MLAFAKLFRKRYSPATHRDFEQYEGKYIIPIMGPSGAGKSTFINQLLNCDVVQVGQSLNSCTSELRAVKIPEEIITQILPGWDPTRKKELILVDTPGFDDTWAEDSEILSRIAQWLAESYGAGAKLAGVIYLFDMSLHRVTPTAKRNFVVFKKLCGSDACRSVVLGTTKWSRIPPDERKFTDAREDQLRDIFWKDMIKQGSTMQRLDGSTSSAWRLVDAVLNKTGHDRNILQIQVELVELEKTLPQTEAARVLTQEIRGALKLMRDGNATRHDIHTLAHNIRLLKPSLFDRLKDFFGS